MKLFVQNISGRIEEDAAWCEADVICRDSSGRTIEAIVYGWALAITVFDDDQEVAYGEFELVPRSELHLVLKEIELRMREVAMPL